MCCCAPQEGDTPEYDLYLGVRLAEASSQAMWGSAHYCVQMSPVQVRCCGAAFLRLCCCRCCCCVRYGGRCCGQHRAVRVAAAGA